MNLPALPDERICWRNTFDQQIQIVGSLWAFIDKFKSIKLHLCRLHKYWLGCDMLMPFIVFKGAKLNVSLDWICSTSLNCNNFVCKTPSLSSKFKFTPNWTSSFTFAHLNICCVSSICVIVSIISFASLEIWSVYGILKDEIGKWWIVNCKL